LSSPHKISDQISTMIQKKPFVSTKSPIMAVFAEEEFNQLSASEKEYSYNFARASWEGSKICYF